MMFEDYKGVFRPILNQWIVSRSHDKSIVNVHSIQTGKVVNSFDTGLNPKRDYGDSALVFHDALAMALSPNDFKKINAWDLNTAKICKEFEAAPQEITNLRISGNRVIGIHKRDDQIPDDAYAFHIWDLESGKLLKSLSFEKDQNPSFVDLSGNLLTFRMQDPKIRTHKSASNQPTHDATKLPPQKQREIIDPTTTLVFSVWDIKNLQKAGEITETLQEVPLNGPPMGCTFRSGILTVDWIAPNGEMVFFIKKYHWPS